MLTGVRSNYIRFFFHLLNHHRNLIVNVLNKECPDSDGMFNTHYVRERRLVSLASWIPPGDGSGGVGRAGSPQQSSAQLCTSMGGGG